MIIKDLLKATFPTDLSYLELVQNFVRESARKFGFSNESLKEIDIAIEEAVSNVIKNAFDAEESNTFDIICERIPNGIKIIIKERGMPFDPKLIPQYDPGKSIDDASAKGMGVFLLKRLVNELSFHNLGLEGKETHLIKYIDGKAPSEAELAKYGTAPAEPEVIKEKIEYDIRAMNEDEAIEISKCAYKSHGYTFFDDHIYYPERLIAMNKSGEMISAVAVTKNNVFMGHAALVFQYPEDIIAEITFVFVNVEYRGQGAFNRLVEYLFALKPQRALMGIYGYAVANHVFTQKAMQRYKINDCGILLATSPSSWKFKGISDDTTQRISVVLCYKYMQEPVKKKLFPPIHHKEMVEKLYINIGAEKHEFTKPDSSAADLIEKESLIKTGINESESCAEIFIAKYGPDIVREVKKLQRGFCLKNIASINLFLNIEDPITYYLTSEFEKLGFFFAGILPGSRVGDALILQYLNNVDFDYSKVNAYSEPAKEMLAYIKKCDQNVEK